MNAERLKTLSSLNRERLNDFIEIVKSQIQLGGFDYLGGLKVPVATLGRAGLTKTDAHNLCSLINKVAGRKIIIDPIKEVMDADPVSLMGVGIGESNSEIEKYKLMEVLRNNKFSFMRISYEDVQQFLFLDIQPDAEKILESIQSQISLEALMTEESAPELDKATKKKLFILEKLKEEWDLLPKKMQHKTVELSSPQWNKWAREADIDGFTQLQNLLHSLQEEGFVIRHEFVDEFQ